eukprot:1990788-Pyramimonas_sp.AAC.1
MAAIDRTPSLIRLNAEHANRSMDALRENIPHPDQSRRVRFSAGPAGAWGGSSGKYSASGAVAAPNARGFHP